MSDGRHMTDYRPHTLLEEQIKYVNGITRDDEARLFLQGNAERIVDREWEYLKKNNSCWLNECVHKYPTRMYPPWFSDELKNYNSLADPNHQPFLCASYGDYRMTETKQPTAPPQKK
jgi:hypothetical protein